ncbi:unnamed protein product [Chondrus crispus]|uniref:Uncharacterized protein n=1 Tax=Chondrus crispus TaxID=2769 RepID=R7QD30_CHOCR|nr:unnamed protein product [Chondrus crispus]CDF35683.1 unnamed protein product [Chondrus crispus]|eukprot:XP_005715502.1 unnamed protein product [Chondrus crispus]
MKAQTTIFDHQAISLRFVSGTYACGSIRLYSRAQYKVSAIWRPPVTRLGRKENPVHRQVESPTRFIIY